MRGSSGGGDEGTGGVDGLVGRVGGDSTRRRASSCGPGRGRRRSRRPGDGDTRDVAVGGARSAVGGGSAGWDVAAGRDVAGASAGRLVASRVGGLGAVSASRLGAVGVGLGGQLRDRADGSVDGDSLGHKNSRAGRAVGNGRGARGNSVDDGAVDSRRSQLLRLRLGGRSGLSGRARLSGRSSRG